VITGILENDCRQLNRRFFTFHEIKRPYVILKWAQSGDGKIAGAGNERLFISNAYTNRLVHKWRTEEDAILVGKSTALQDNPALTARLWPGKNPLRLVIDKNLELPGSLSLFDREAKTIVFNFLKQINEGNIQYYQLNKTRQLPEQIVDSLYKMQLLSVIIEGGAKTLQSFIEAGFWDEARVITNTSIRTGFGLAAPVLKANSLLAEQIINDDHIQYYQNSQVNRNTA
jgi:diaminohydroxyphosphoribosylaminopyrimidine deaminase / 5-amino-6-(5-phosphoribosylamino)uracil reductase